MLCTSADVLPDRTKNISLMFFRGVWLFTNFARLIYITSQLCYTITKKHTVGLKLT